ncbi:MAG: glycosyltransferase family 2 protein [Elusimicrobiota bacterium]|nr:glycosyltransferase [Endomicrobiia bacterium]MDW7973102.1 glycosyltransferase family 2 protein [Thermodesulfovibrio sp.]MDW8166713.1 glycosyltransferase family 2 protein [Elusimicrobiota bacterium]
MKGELCSILVPVYNREETIEEAIKAALNQTYENIEVVVVDNCSEDKTWDKLRELASKDKRLRIFRNDKNIGPVKNWKKCVELAKGKYAKFLWSDDLISYNFLEKTIPFLAENNRVGFVFTKTEIFYNKPGDGKIVYDIGETGVYRSEDYINGVLFGRNFPVSPGCAVFRLEDLAHNLIIDIPNKCEIDFANVAIGNDLLIFLLTASRYPYLAFVNETLSFFRSYKDSISVLSGSAKLSLHYTLAAAYFVENFRKDLIKKMNTRIWLNLIRYRKEAKLYNLDKIQNYYLDNNDYSKDYALLFATVLKFVLRKVFKK